MARRKPVDQIVQPSEEENYHGVPLSDYKVGRRVVVNLNGVWQEATITQAGRKDGGSLVLQVEDNAHHQHELRFTEEPAPTVVEFVPPTAGQPAQQLFDDSRGRTRISIEDRAVHISDAGHVEYTIHEERYDENGQVILGRTRNIERVPQEILVLWEKTLELEEKLNILTQQLSDTLPVHRHQLQMERLQTAKFIADIFTQLPEFADMQDQDRRMILDIQKNIKDKHRQAESELKKFEESITEAVNQKSQHRPGKTEMVYHVETEQERAERSQFAKDFRVVVDDNLKQAQEDLVERKRVKKEEHDDALAAANTQIEANNETVDTDFETDTENYQSNHETWRSYQAQREKILQQIKTEDSRVENNFKRVESTQRKIGDLEKQHRGGGQNPRQGEIDVLVLERDNLSFARQAIEQAIDRLRNDLGAIPNDPEPPKPIKRQKRTKRTTLAPADENAYSQDIRTMEREGLVLKEHTYRHLIAQLEQQGQDPAADPRLRTLFEELQRRRWQMATKGGRNTETVPAIGTMPEHRDFEDNGTDTSPRALKNIEILNAILAEWGKDEPLAISPEVDKEAVKFDFTAESAKALERAKTVKDKIPFENGAPKEGFKPISDDFDAAERKLHEDSDNLVSLDRARHYQPFEDYVTNPPLNLNLDTASHAELANHLQEFRINLLSAHWEELGRIGERIVDQTREKDKQESAWNRDLAYAEQININSEDLREILQPNMGEVEQALRSMFTDTVGINKESRDNPSVPESVLRHFQNLITVNSLQSLATQHPEIHERLRRAGVKNFDKFKRFWDDKLARELAINMYQMARQTLMRELEERIGLLDKVWANRHQMAGRMALNFLLVGGSSMAMGELVRGLASADITSGGLKFLQGTGAMAGGVTGGLMRWFSAKKVFGRKTSRDRQDEADQALRVQRSGEIVNQMVQTLGTAGAPGLTDFSETMAQTMRSVKGQAIKARILQSGESDEIKAEVQKLSGDDVIRYAETLEASGRRYEPTDTVGETEKKREEAGKRELAQLLQIINGHGNLMTEKMKTTKGGSVGMKWADKLMLEYSGQGSAKGAAVSGVALSGLFMLSAEARIAFGALLGGYAGIKGAEQMRLQHERQASRERLFATMVRVRNDRLNFGNLNNQQRQALRNDVIELKRLLHGNAEPEDLTAVVYMASVPERDENGTIVRDNKGNVKIEPRPMIDGNLLARVQGIVYEAERTGVLLEHPEDRENLDSILESLRRLGKVDEKGKIVGEVAGARTLTWPQKFAREAHKFAWRAGGAVAGAAAGGVAYLVFGAIAREGMKHIFGVADVHAGPKIMAGAAAAGAVESHGGIASHVEPAPERHGVEVDTEVMQAGRHEIQPIDQFSMEHGLSPEGKSLIQDLIDKYPELNNQKDLNDIWDASKHTAGMVEKTDVSRESVIFDKLAHSNPGHAKQFLIENMDVHGKAGEYLDKAGGIDKLVEDYLANKKGAVKGLPNILHAADATILDNQIEGVEFRPDEQGHIHDIAVQNKDAHILGVKDGHLVVEGGKEQLFTHELKIEVINEDVGVKGVDINKISYPQGKTLTIGESAGIDTFTFRANYSGQDYLLQQGSGTDQLLNVLYDPVTGERLGYIGAKGDIISEVPQGGWPKGASEKIDVSKIVKAGTVVTGTEIASSQVKGGGGGGGESEVAEAVKMPETGSKETFNSFYNESGAGAQKAHLVTTDSGNEYLAQGVSISEGKNNYIIEIAYDKNGNRIGFIGEDGKVHTHSPHKGWPEGLPEKLPQSYIPESEDIMDRAKVLHTETQDTQTSVGKLMNAGKIEPGVQEKAQFVSLLETHGGPTGTYESVAVTPATEDDIRTLTLDSGKKLDVSLDYMSDKAGTGDFVRDFTNYANANSGKDNFEALQKVMNGEKDYTLEYNPKAENIADKFRVKYKGDVVF